MRWGLLVGLLVAARPVQAEPATTVVLVRTRADDGGRWRVAEDRTRDELRLMGLRVVEAEVREDAREVERAMTEHGARVAVHLGRKGEVGAAEMWWWAETGSTLEAARIEGLATEGRGAAAVAALRAAELVRGETQARGEPRREVIAADESPRPGAVERAKDRAGARDSSGAVAAERAEVAGGRPGAGDTALAGAADEAGVVPAVTIVPSTAGAPARPGSAWRSGPVDPLELVETAPPTPAPAPGPTRARGAGALGLYAGVGGGPGGAGTLVGGDLALRWHVAQVLALQGEIHGGTSPVWLEGQEASFRIGLAGARAALVFVVRRDARVGWRLGLGGGLTLAWALGRTPDRLRSSQDRVAVAVLRASVHAAVRAGSHLRVVVGVDVDLLVPPVAVRVLGVEMARFGTPLVRGVLGLEWDGWPRSRRR